MSTGAEITALPDEGPSHELCHGPVPQVRIFQVYSHNIMEENFHILQGKVDMLTARFTPSAGDFIHIEPGEVHYVINPYDEPVPWSQTPCSFPGGVDKVECRTLPIKINIWRKPALDEKIVRVSVLLANATRRVAACGGPFLWN